MITVATYGRNGSSARVRIHDWLDYLGVEAAQSYEYLGLADNSFTTLSKHVPQVLRAERSLRALAKSGTTETLLMSREASPLSNGRLERSILQSAEYSVYDFDDAIFHNAAPFPYNLYPKGKVWLRSVQNADHVIAGNDYLAEEAAKRSKSVQMIPSCVHPEDYVRKTQYGLSERMTLVWMGSPATEPFLDALVEPLMRLNKEIPVTLRVISRGHRSFGPLDEIVERVDWHPETFGTQLADADAGLMPLPDTEFTRGKCAYKLLQYGAAALPVIGSPVGVNRQVIDQFGGLAASNSTEWEAAVRAIRNSKDTERLGMGEQARNAVDAGYSFSAWAPHWKAAMRL